MKLITVWERGVYDRALREWSYIYNHISDGYDCDQIKPATITDEQEKAWKGIAWRSYPAMQEKSTVRNIELELNVYNGE